MHELFGQVKQFFILHSKDGKEKKRNKNKNLLDKHFI